MSRGGRCLTLTVAMLGGLAACSPSAQLKVSYGEWETLAPGAPPGDPAGQLVLARTLHEGQGDVVGLGDLVELRLATRMPRPDGQLESHETTGSGWVWIGFDGERPGDFPVSQNAIGAALIGLRTGAEVVFAAAPAGPLPGIAGGAGQRPFGRAPTFAQPAPGAKGSGTIWADQGPQRPGTKVQIGRVCHGRAEQRRITLFDDSKITVAQDLGRTYETREPRWLFLREARWTGACGDGRRVRFETGPIEVEAPPGMSRGLIVSKLWEPWLRDAWKKVPSQVVVE